MRFPKIKNFFYLRKIESSTYYVIGFLIIAAFIFWHPLFLANKIPWLGDVSRQYYPWYFELHRHLRNLELPFWIPEMGAGYPLLAEGEVGAFYPLNWLLIFLFSPSFGFKLYFLIHSLIASFSAYLLARTLNLSKTTSLFSSLIFSYSFFFTAHSLHPSIIATSSLLPAGLWVVEKIIRTENLKVGLCLSIIVALQLLIGHPQITFISICFYTFFLFVRFLLYPQIRKKWLRYFLIVSICIILGIGLAGIQVFPTLSLSHYSSRQEKGSDFIFSYSLPKSHFLTYIFPYLFGVSPPNSNLGFRQFGGLYWEFALYIGVLPLIFVFITVLGRKKATYERVFILSFLIFAILSLGGYQRWYRVLLRLLHLPFRVSARFLLPTTLSLSLLSGSGFDQLIKLRKKIRLTPVLILGSLGLAPLILATLIDLYSHVSIVAEIGSLLTKFLKLIIFTEFQDIDFTDFSLIQVNILIPVLMLFVTLGLLFLWVKGKISKLSFIILVFGIFFADSYFQGFLYQMPVSENILSQPSFTEYFSNDKSRIFTFSEPGPVEIEKLTLQPNINLIWDIPSFNSVTPLPLRQHEEFYTLGTKNPQLFNAFGVSHIISQTPLFYSDILLKEKNRYSYIYENQRAFRHFFMVYDYLTVQDGKRAVELVEKHAADLDKKVILTSEEPEIIKGREFNEGENKIKQDKYTSTLVKFSVETETEGIFVFLESFYPEWRAFIDGENTQIFPANGIFRAVFVPIGTHTVEFRYVPKNFYAGLAVTTFSLILLVILYKTNILLSKL